MNSFTRTDRIYSFLLWICCVCSVSALLMYSVKWGPRLTHGFAAYYTYARIVLDRSDFQSVYDFDYFNARIHEYGLGKITDIANNIPTNALAMAGIAWMRPSVAKISWSMIQLAALVLSVKLLFSLYAISFTEDFGLALTALVALGRPVYENIALGQLYLVLLLLFSLSLFGIIQKKRYVTSVPLSLTFLLKGYGAIPLIWLIFKKEYKTALIAVLGILGIVLATLPLFHIQAWITYFTEVFPTLGRLPAHGNVAYQTLNGFLRHIFTYDAVWLPFPLMRLSETLVVLSSMFVNVLLIVLVIRCSDSSTREGTLLSYSTAIAAGVVTAPLAEEYHYVLFLPLIVGLLVHAIRAYSTTTRLDMLSIGTVLAVIVMSLPLHYKALQLAPSFIVLLAYPKLYAGIALLIVSMVVTSRMQSPAAL